MTPLKEGHFHRRDRRDHKENSKILRKHGIDLNIFYLFSAVSAISAVKPNPSTRRNL
jgi:hypothetical protein